MRALTVTPGVKNSIKLDQIDTPNPTSSQALLRVQEIGICGTDLDINQGFYGEAPPGSNYLVTGHESLARVESILSNAYGISKGDLVVPTVRRPDSCMNCLNGESDMCLTGNYREHGIKRLHGFGSDFAVSDVGFLVKVPSKLADVAVLLEPMSVAREGSLPGVQDPRTNALETEESAHSRSGSRRLAHHLPLETEGSGSRRDRYSYKGQC